MRDPAGFHRMKIRPNPAAALYNLAGTSDSHDRAGRICANQNR